MQGLGFWTPGPIEIVVIVLVAGLIFGAKLSNMIRTLGRTIVEWKKGMNEFRREK